MDRFLASVEARALRMARFATRRSEDAFDIVQDAMLGMVTHYAGHAPEDWPPLFYRVLTSRIRDWQRRRAVRARLFFWQVPDTTGEDPLAMLPDSSTDPVATLAGGAALQQLEAAIAALPDRQREAFLLRAWEGLDVAQTATAMRCSTGSVKTHYSRAQARLREALSEHWP